MMLRKIVQIKPDFLLERLGDEIIVYHPTLTTSIYLNETGALVWQLCDGRRSVGETIDILRRLYPESEDRIEPEVCALLNSLVAQQVAHFL